MGSGVKKSYGCTSTLSEPGRGFALTCSTTAGRSWSMTRPARLGYRFLNSTHCAPIDPPTSMNKGVELVALWANCFSKSKTSKKAGRPSLWMFMYGRKTSIAQGFWPVHAKGCRSVFWPMFQQLGETPVGSPYPCCRRKSGSFIDAGEITLWLRRVC